MSMVRAVYVGEQATLEQVRAAVETWQQHTGDATYLDVEADGDGYPGMGYVIDLLIRDEDAQLAARDRLAEGIKPLLPGIPVATDTEMNDRQIAAAPERHR
ncbi:hypothetical protein [Mycobacterium heckeshornense]|uniref:hypothetical protein n=1 Tax=Mycobacterium heckeshornense TaxID=110505 RepID=UPI001944B4DC|nr:hypothetical protein [Mycobacterium heckeshornense]